MWVVAGILLGAVVVASLVGFHSGAHTHAIAGAVGVAAAAWLILMAAEGRSAPLLWALLAADVVVSVGIGVMAWTGLTNRVADGPHYHSLDGAEGVAVSDLCPDGIIRIRGEQWSAVAVNGTVRAGGRVQVLHGSGVRLDVWGEDPEIQGPLPGESEEKRT